MTKPVANPRASRASANDGDRIAEPGSPQVLQGPGNKRYKAFISYSHADEAAVNSLVQQLERFRIPKPWFNRKDHFHSLPRTLRPFFLDRIELSATGSLKNEIEKALDNSDFLIVMCSPSAARSPWVNAEIRYFRERHGPDRIRAVIVDGDPALSPLTNPEKACFPPELVVEGAGGVRTHEPVAPDLRAGGDGEQMTVLKLVAGMIGVGLDDIVRRHEKRNRRTVTWITSLAGSIVIVFGVLGLSAWLGWQAAERTRGEAEDLIEFMLTDLTEKLRDVGQLEALTSVGAEVEHYYGGSDPRDLTAERLGRRARAFHVLGEAALDAGQLTDARRVILQSYNETRAALTEAPKDLDRLFEHAQSAYWVGALGRREDDPELARLHFEEYYKLSEKMVLLAPEDPKYRLEAAYGYNSMGMTHYYARDYRGAIKWFKLSRDVHASLLTEEPENEDRIESVANSYIWIGDCWTALDDHSQSLQARKEASDILLPLVTEPLAASKRALRIFAGNLSVGASNLQRLGRIKDIPALIDGHRPILLALLERSDGDAHGIRMALFPMIKLADAQISLDDANDTETLLKFIQAWGAKTGLPLKDSPRSQQTILLSPTLQLYRLAMLREDYQTADRTLDRLIAGIEEVGEGFSAYHLREGFELLLPLYQAERLERYGQREGARAHWQTIIRIFERNAWMADRLVMLVAARTAYDALGMVEKAADLQDDIDAFGTYHPDGLL